MQIPAFGRQALSVLIVCWLALGVLDPQTCAQTCVDSASRSSTILMIDHSSSMDGSAKSDGSFKGMKRWQVVKEQCPKILEDAISSGKSGRFTIIYFGYDVEIQDFELPAAADAARKALSDRLARGLSGGTALHAALHEGIQRANAELDRNSSVRFVLVSDGEDDAGKNVELRLPNGNKGWIYEDQIQNWKDEHKKFVEKSTAAATQDRLRIDEIWLGTVETRADGVDAHEPAIEVALQLADPMPGPFGAADGSVINVCMREGPFSLPWPDNGKIDVRFEPAAGEAAADIREGSVALRKGVQQLHLLPRGDGGRGT
ncbi:MAG: vWA domain-containing protein, partial [Phycisphaerales bacterium]